MKLIQPRFRFYNTLQNYATALADFFDKRDDGAEQMARTERKLADYLGVRHVILAPQGRVAMYLGLKAVLKPGKKVILSPYTLYDVVNMVLLAGGVPVFADIERESCNIDSSNVERLLDADTGAVMITHLHGMMADVSRLKSICEARGIPLLEDSCQALGAQYQGKKAGTFGAIGFFSTGRAKNINSFLGGFAATDNDDYAAYMRRELATWPLETQDRLWKRIAGCLIGDILTCPMVFPFFTFWIFRYGAMHDVESVTRQFNTEIAPTRKMALPDLYRRRMTRLQAKLIELQLSKIDTLSRARIALARQYHEGLKDVPDVSLPPLREDMSHIYLTYPVQVQDRHGLQRYMAEHLRDVVIQHLGNTADYVCFEEFRTACPEAKFVASSVLLLPSYSRYRPDQVRKNIEIIKKYAREHNS